MAATSPRLYTAVRAIFWLCAAAVLYLALVPDPVVSVSTWDKANHAFAFVVLGILGLTAWPTGRRQVLVWLVAYGCLIEVLQSFTPTRQGDWHDVVADVVGLLMAWVIVAAFSVSARVWRQ